MVYLYFIAGSQAAANTSDDSYSGIAVQVQQGDCADAADVLQVSSLCILWAPAEMIAGVAGGVDRKWINKLIVVAINFSICNFILIKDTSKQSRIFTCVIWIISSLVLSGL